MDLFKVGGIVPLHPYWLKRTKRVLELGREIQPSIRTCLATTHSNVTQATKPPLLPPKRMIATIVERGDFQCSIRTISTKASYLFMTRTFSGRFHRPLSEATVVRSAGPSQFSLANFLFAIFTLLVFKRGEAGNWHQDPCGRGQV